MLGRSYRYALGTVALGISTFGVHQSYNMFKDSPFSFNRDKELKMQSWSLVNYKSYGLFQKKHGYILIPTSELTDPVHKVVESKVKCSSPIITNVQTFERPINCKMAFEIGTNSVW